MAKFEYLVVQTDQAETTPHVQNTFNTYGDDGWELVAMDKKFWVFKRLVYVASESTVPCPGCAGGKWHEPDCTGTEEEPVDYSVAE